MSFQPYRDFRKKDKAPSPGPGVGTPTKRAVGRVNRFGVTSFTSIRDGNAAANGNSDAYSFEDDTKPGERKREPISRIEGEKERIYICIYRKRERESYNRSAG